LTIVWVGFDNNEPIGTGAQMALPIWGTYHRKIAPLLGTEDFAWPEGAVLKTINVSSLAKDFNYLNTVAQRASELQLVFSKD
jgi:membrane carboxypeptidase/penicillin-binding protein